MREDAGTNSPFACLDQSQLAIFDFYLIYLSWMWTQTKNIRIHESDKFREDGTQQSGEVPPGPSSRLLPSPLLTSSVEVADLPDRWLLQALCFDWLTFATANTLAVSVIKIINPRLLTQTCFMASAVIISQHISLDGDKVDHSVITKQSGRAKLW